MSASSRLARWLGDCIHCSLMFCAFGPAATFSDNQLKLPPARVTRLGRLGSPGSVCEIAFWAAIASACWRAAVARASFHFRGGSPLAARCRLMAWKSCCSAVSALGWANADVDENTAVIVSTATSKVFEKVVINSPEGIFGPFNYDALATPLLPPKVWLKAPSGRAPFVTLAT